MRLRSIMRQALVSGSIASVTSTLALAAMARSEGKAAVRPTNATSHWLNGEGAAAVETADVDHTAVGYATHHAATVFWGLLFEAWAGRGRRKPARELAGGALVLAGLAAAVDYGATPKRFTPGWELVLSKRSMGVAYAAMAFGLAVGAARARPVRRRSHR